MVDPPYVGRLHNCGILCPPFWSENWVWARWVYPGNLGILMRLRVGYQVSGYLLFQRTSIAVYFYQITWIAGPPQGNSSFSCPGMGICCLLWFEPFPYSKKGVYLYRLYRFPLWIVGVGWPLPCSLFVETFLTNILSIGSSYWLWTLLDRYYDICCDMLFGWGGLYNFQTGNKQPSWQGMPIRTHQLLILVLSSHHHGIFNNHHQRRSG